MNTIFIGKHVFVLERDGWEYVERKRAKEAAAVIAITEEDELILVEQYRRPVDARVIDWPAGLVEDGDTAEVTAIKELQEETGFICDRVNFLARCATSPGITSEVVTLFRAQGVRRKGSAEEGITVHFVPRAAARQWLEQQSGLVDLKVWAGLYFVTQST